MGHIHIWRFLYKEIRSTAELISKPELIRHIMCLTILYNYLVFGSLKMPQKEKKYKYRVEEFFLPCTVMSRKFHSLHLVQVTSGMDFSDDKGLLPSYCPKDCSQFGISVFSWVIRYDCECAPSVFVSRLHLLPLHSSEYFTLFPSLPSILIEIFRTAAVI